MLCSPGFKDACAERSPGFKDACAEPWKALSRRGARPLPGGGRGPFPEVGAALAGRWAGRAGLWIAQRGCRWVCAAIRTPKWGDHQGVGAQAYGLLPPLSALWRIPPASEKEGGSYRPVVGPVEAFPLLVARPVHLLWSAGCTK